jgi:hypothetical protein
MNSITGSWKTTLAGLLAAVAHVSVNGVGWKQLAVAAAIALLGAVAGDHPKVAAAILLALMLAGSPVMAQTNAVPPPQHFSLSGQVISYMGAGGSTPATIVDGYFNVTARVALGYQQIIIPTLATAKLGVATYSLPLNSLVGKKLSAKFVFDSSKIGVTFLAGAGKLNQTMLGVNRTAETAGACVSYPIGANVSIKLVCGQWIHGGIVQGFLTTGVPASPTSSTSAVSSGLAIHF